MASLLHKVNNWRKNQKLRERSTEFVLAAFVALLPFQWDFPPISLFIMLLGAVFLFFLDSSYPKAIFTNGYFWPILIYYALVLIGLTYSEHTHEGGKDAQVQIALIAWPLGIAALRSVTPEMVPRLCLYFTRSLALSSALLLIYAAQRYLDGAGHNTFFYKNLSIWELVSQHYLSMYMSFGILILIHRWFFSSVKLSRWHSAEILAYLTLFITMQALLSVRIQLIALPIALLPILIRAYRLGRLGKRSMRIGGLVFLLGVIGVGSLPGTQRRAIETYHEIRSFNRMVEKKQTNHRVYLWKAGFEVFKEHPMIGAGTGSSNAFMNDKLLHVNAKFWDGEKVYYLRDKEYNVHNVYLQAAMTYGFIGFLVVCWILFVPLFKAIKANDALTAGFLLLAIVSFTTESMLERQAGVLWFGVFYSLLVVANKKLVTTAKR